VSATRREGRSDPLSLDEAAVNTMRMVWVLLGVLGATVAGDFDRSDSQ
jgi:hypothetical protein